MREKHLVLEVEKVSTELLLGDLVGGRLAVIRQLTHGPQVSMYGTLSHAGELKVLTHQLVQLSMEEAEGGGRKILLTIRESLMRRKRTNKERCPRPRDRLD